MKKFNIFLMGAMALGFVACEDGPSEVPVQSNPQGPIFESGNVVAVQAGPITSGSLDLAKYESSNLEIATVQSIDSIVGNVTPSFGFQYAKSADFSDAIDIPVTMNGNTGSVNGDDLMTAHIALFGKSPNAQTVYYRIPLFINKDGVDYRWGGVDYYVGQGTYQETIPVINNPMQLYCPGGANGWSFGDNCSRVPFLSEEGVWQYQGIIYADGEFKFTAADNWDLNWGTGEEAGKLYENGGNIAAAAGIYWAQVELSTYTYNIVPITSVGLVGDMNEWNIGGYYEMTPNEAGNIYTWTGDLTGEWKIAFNNSWNYNYGGILTSPEFDGSNISGYEGNYTVTLDCTGAYPVITVK